jgi:hypothetical protein
MNLGRNPSPHVPSPLRKGRGGIKFWEGLPRAALADSLCPGLFSGHPYGIQEEKEAYWERPVGYKHGAPTELLPRTDGGSIVRTIAGVGNQTLARFSGPNFPLNTVCVEEEAIPN